MDSESNQKAELNTVSGTKEFKVVTQEEWEKARKELLVKEKEFTKLRDELSKTRRELPWVKVDKKYTFDGPNGKETLSDLFAEKSQLIVYHFMLAADWDSGCKSCSYWADNMNGIDVHLKHRDTTLLLISHAHYDKIKEIKEKMGWSLKWVSSANTDFNYDYHVSFTPEQVNGQAEYNYKIMKPWGPEAPGVSVFTKDANGDIYHTYSCYSRGLDMLNGAYHILDLTPKGRDERKGPTINPMEWVCRHNEYTN